MLRYEVLPGLPAAGPMSLPINAGEWAGAWGGQREGFVVRFHPNTGEAWVGNFQPGSNGWEGVLEHPNGQHLIVVARGQGYIVDPQAHQVVSRFSRDVQHVIPLPELGAIVFSDGLGFEAIKEDGMWWQSPRISWDEIRNINVEGTILRGEASMPMPDGNTWVSFTVDLMTGHSEDGTYQSQIRRSIPVKPSRG